LSTVVKRWVASKKGAKHFLSGHPWVFIGDIIKGVNGTPPGAIVELVDEKEKFLGHGITNAFSQIAFRQLSRSPRDFKNSSETLASFVIDKLVAAANRRFKDNFLEYSHRLCFAEADSLPGLVIDCFVLEDDYQCFSIQASTAAMDQLLPSMSGILETFLSRLNKYTSRSWDKSFVILKNDALARKLEGLPAKEISENEEEKEAIILKNCPTSLSTFSIKIKSASKNNNNYLLFSVDLQGGQKTGFFLDQYHNISLLLENLNFSSRIDDTSPIRILDLFSYVGQWSTQLTHHLTYLRHQVIATVVDSSASALDLAYANVLRAGGQCRIIKSDIIKKNSQLLETLAEEKFDIVICDPPALIKNRNDYYNGKSAYQQLNNSLLSKVKVGGYFISCSCSQHLSESDLTQIVANAAQKNSCHLKTLAHGGHSLDHPTLANFPQGNYLKAIICQIIDASKEHQ